MAYWLTTHWPHREDSPPDEASGIWLPDGRQMPGAKIRSNDFVFVYQSQSGKTLVRQLADGTTSRSRCLLGRGGVIHLGTVLSPLSALSDSEPEQYSDGSTIWWRWFAPVKVLTRSGFVPREKVARILGYDPAYNFHGFGHQHSGLRELSEDEFHTLLMEFKISKPLVLPPKSVRPRGHKSIGGGESKEHKQLKEFVASNPAVVLKEDGLRTVQVEYSFTTGDQADIVLADKFDRIIGVEVELFVGDTDEVGVLQAIKYRRMLEWCTNRECGDSRSILVAHHISSKMKRRCAKYNVECFEIPK